MIDWTTKGSEAEGMTRCCLLHLWQLAPSWRGHVTYCRCGTLLVLRDGVWQAR